ncbi:molybdopterin molybdenumtransferase MoeA [Egibacter rhizosphaerae]|uniref:Molybdopterin molybdenumtransferase n=1 Tax=Egibacter rhizosphaerae TaxID=1670831 RepID=A0A411YIM9_9ACTN|nr:gephyrin-like molybdotransferase Glp [Egibacter rhizosphaerae]QBI21090.1 molybdopterin molybdenumtransferase MoeA [Egibacter rhizosphaerae]
MTARAAAGELVPLVEYRREVLESITPLDPIDLALLEAHGCVLAADVTAAGDVPPFDNTAMDGYAVRGSVLEAGEEFELVGTVAAGAQAEEPLGPGQAVRIMTGAPVPEGTDAIVPVELARERDGSVLLEEAARPGAHIRSAGESARAGDTLLDRGRSLGAPDLGMLAAVGNRSVRVHPRPRVVVVSTGDELVEPGRPLAPGQIRDSNSYMLTAMAREAGAVAYRQLFVRDDPRALREAFEGAFSHADVLVTSGGVSAGLHDHVKGVLAQLGDVRFRKIGMKPGMPQAFGFVDRVPCFALPGNPVSAFVSFEVFVRPTLLRMQGRQDLNRPRVTAVFDGTHGSPGEKVEFVRVRLAADEEAGWRALPTGEQGSGILQSAVLADGLAEIPADVTEVAAGSRVTVHVLDDDVR